MFITIREVYKAFDKDARDCDSHTHPLILYKVAPMILNTDNIVRFSFITGGDVYTWSERTDPVNGMLSYNLIYSRELREVYLTNGEMFYIPEEITNMLDVQELADE